MSGSSPQLLARALAAIERLQGRLDALRSPVAVVGMGCRLPGSPDVGAYWGVLRDGVDAVGEVPADRWDAAALFHPEPATPGRMYARAFGSVPDLRGFDAGFFGISPREAASLDPQQRLVLEVAWEALEDAGIPPDGLGGSATGVFMAACGTDYFQALLGRGEAGIDPYFASGTVHSMVSGRLSYVLGLTGPSLSVDTACSSSLVAVHLAVRALRNGECDMALAGGVNRIILPTYGIAFAQSRMLSPDGRCKAFDASADGYGRAEGCGVVVLKRLSDARAAGDRVLAVIRGSAVNQDGATSGLTVPNGPAQAAVIRAALADAGVEAGAVGLIEAHGTGTSLGDPIEMGALRDVFAGGRSAGDPLWVGSAKTNIGHAEGAAGVAGLIKLVLALRHRTMPGHLHLRAPSPLIDWAGGALAVPVAARGWTERLVGGVSSFGFSGTNAHVVVEAAEAEGVAVAPGPGVYVVSGKDAGALEAGVAAHAAALAGGSVPWGSAWRMAGAGRSHFSHRVAVVADDAVEAARLLAVAPRGRVAAGGRARVAFLFTGQGSVVPGMGLDLPAAGQAVLDEADGVLAGALGRPLRAVLGDAGLLARTDHAQPALYAVQCALVACWRGWGISPAWVLGHSVGEYAAGYAAGVFDFAAGLRLVLARGLAMQGSPAGGMVAVALDAGAAGRLIAGEADVAVAAENGPGSTVLSGPVDALRRVVAGMDVRWLEVSHGFHSPLMRGAAAAFRGAFAGVALRAPRVSFVRTGGAGEVTDPEYWVGGIEAPVRFGAGMAQLGEASAFVEVGARPVLLGLGRRCLPEGERAWVPSLVPGEGAERSLLVGVAALHMRGVAVAFPRGPVVGLPTYPWQRTDHWAAPERVVERGRAEAVDSFYTRLTRLFDGLERHGEAHPEDDIFLTFAPFPAVVPGFSWIMTSRFPEQRREHFRLCLAAQRQMRAMLFRHVDFGACGRALDLGCGNGSDVVALARRYPHLHLVGQTIARGQAEVGARKAARMGVADRVSIRHADSAVARSEEMFDLVFGFEVIHHVADKAGLFATIGAQLAPGGRLVAADFIASDGLVIDDDATMSGFLDAAEWSEGLARQGLAVTDVVDVSEAVANFLEDPGLEGHLDAIGSADADIREAFRGFVRLGALLRRGDVRYVLLDAVKAGAEAAAGNAGRLAGLVPYDALAPARWLYERRWEDAGGEAVASVAARVGGLGVLDDPAVEAGRLALPLLEALSDAYAARALGGAVMPQHGRLAAALRGRARAGDVGALVAALDGPAVAAELALVRRCGEALPGVLAGEVDPLTLLFPDGDMGALTHIYEQAPVARAMNAALAAACSGLGGGRVLEIGGGTGGSTSWVLDALGGRCREYVFTDVSEAFLAAARSRFGGRFGGRAGFAARRLDIEVAPGGQGFAAGSFDLVVAANVLHATRDVRASLRHAVSLLAPGGALVLLEGTAPRHWVDLTFGLTEGWWRFSDTGLRGEHPLLPGDVWAGLLGELGLEVAVVPGGRGLLFDQALVMGRRGVAAGDWLVVRDAGGLEARLLEREWAGVALVAEEGGGFHPPYGGCRWVLEGLQGLERAGFSGRVVVATRDAVAAVAGDGVSGVGGSAVWGLAGVAGLEHPEWGLRRVDLGAGDDDGVLLAECGRDDGEDQVAWRSGRRLVARLVRRAWPGAVQSTFRDPSNSPVMAGLDPAIHVVPPDQAADGHAHNGSGSGQRHGVDRRIKSGDDVFGEPGAVAPMAYRGTWLVTGGLGGLGRAVAGWLLGRGVARVVLVGRHGGDAGIAGAEVRVADVRDRGALGAVVAEFAGELRGVVHAAGVLDDGALGSLDWGRFEGVLGAKVLGAGHLDELTAGLELDGFVLFSSAASLLGNAGQANHAAANAWLDGLAQRRRAAGRPGLSVNWGAWGGIGSAVDALGRQAPGWSRFMAPEDALAALGILLDGGAVVTGVVPVDWGRFPRSAPFFDGLRPVVAQAAAASGGGLAGVLAGVLGLAASALEPDRPLHDYGFDSLMAISLRNRLRAQLGADLPLATIMQGSSLRGLQDAIDGRAARAPAAPAVAVAHLDAADADAMLDELLAEQSVGMEPG